MSGKAAKAAMFYITDYITKADLKTYQVLSLLAKAVLNLSYTGGSANNPKTLLYKCVSQLTRQQQIHAQQVARYLRGSNDGIQSHRTVPMLSGLMISYIEQQLKSDTGSDSTIDIDTESNHSEDDSDDDLDEDTPNDIEIKIVLDDKGKLKESNQVHDYIFRAESLANMTFYDFVRCVRLEKISESRMPKNTSETRLGVFARHTLKEGQPLHLSHFLVEHTNSDRGDGNHKLLPRIVGCSIPRKNDKRYPLFCLIHFKPFGVNTPICNDGLSPEITYNNYIFTEDSMRIINNWDAIHECEDERDAERIRKQNTRMKESTALKSSLYFNTEENIDDDENDVLLQPEEVNTKADIDAKKAVLDLNYAGWFDNSLSSKNVIASENNLSVHNITPTLLKSWKKSIKEQESIIISQR